MQNQTIGQMQPVVHAPHPAMDGMGIDAKTSEGLDIRGMAHAPRRRAAGSGWLHDLDSRQAALPTGVDEEIARPRAALGVRLR
jgi:hypothetical protein